MSHAIIPTYRIQQLGGNSQINPVPHQAEVFRPLPRADPNSVEEVQDHHIDTIMESLRNEIEAHNKTRTQLQQYYQTMLHWERWFKKSDVDNQHLHGVIQNLRTKAQEDEMKQLEKEYLNSHQDSHNGLPGLLESPPFECESDSYSPTLRKRGGDVLNSRPKRSRIFPSPADNER